MIDDKLENFILSSQLKDEELLGSVFRILVSQYPDETDRQHVIRAMVMIFEDKYPGAMRRHQSDIKKRQETRANEHAADYNTDMRLAFALPEGLPTRINMVFDRINQPPFLDEKMIKENGEDEWFRTNFPRYAVSEKN